VRKIVPHVFFEAAAGIGARRIT